MKKIIIEGKSVMNLKIQIPMHENVLVELPPEAMNVELVLVELHPTEQEEVTTEQQ